MYKFWYGVMLLSYFMLSIQGQGLKMKLIGFILTIANALIFWR